jgi:hypothetical protein
MPGPAWALVPVCLPKSQRQNLKTKTKGHMCDVRIHRVRFAQGATRPPGKRRTSAPARKQKYVPLNSFPLDFFTVFLRVFQRRDLKKAIEKLGKRLKKSQSPFFPRFVYRLSRFCEFLRKGV